MYSYIVIESLGWFLFFLVVAFVLVKNGVYRIIHRKLSELRRSGRAVNIGTVFAVLLIAGFLVTYGRTTQPIHFAMPPTMHSHSPDKNPPSLPLASLVRFLLESRSFDRVDDIGADPEKVPMAIDRSGASIVNIDLVAQEVIAEVSPGIYNNYWTFNGQVPGPMLRIKEGDTVEVKLTNHESSIHNHNIDFHATTGPGGGAKVSNVAPGETKEFTWKALSAGLYVYHCATSNVSVHNSHGQYGMILVEPKEGFSGVDKEFYLMQGELYTQGGIGRKGLLAFDANALLSGNPTYVTFNGTVEKTPRMKAKVGDRIRMYVGNGGVNLVSSFHIIGEIFDKVYPEAAVGPKSAIYNNVQTTTVLPGGATIVEFTVDVPGEYLIVDHALSRMNKGAWAVLKVEGPSNQDIFSGRSDANQDQAGHVDE